MIKTLFFFTLFSTVMASPAMAQQLSNQVVNATGGVGAVGGNTIAYAVGEPVTTTLSTGNVTLTQGFLQPEIRVRTGIYVQSNADNCAFSIFPNPTTERILTEDSAGRTFDILTLQGQIIGSYQPKNGAIDVSQLPQGIYLIRSLCGAKVGQFTTLKFIKQ
jgi:Secretion system C-terminal sorting domain